MKTLPVGVSFRDLVQLGFLSFGRTGGDFRGFAPINRGPGPFVDTFHSASNLPSASKKLQKKFESTANGLRLFLEIFARFAISIFLSLLSCYLRCCLFALEGMGWVGRSKRYR